MARDRNIGPFPFRLGAGRVADTEPTLAEALRLWWNWRAWQARIVVSGGSIPFAALVEMPRQNVVIEERRQRQIDDDENTGRDAVAGRAHVAEASVTIDIERAFVVALSLFSRGRGPLSDSSFVVPLPVAPTPERGIWNGTHLVARRSSLVPGRVQPTVALEMAGSWGTGASEYFWSLSTLATSGDFTATVTINIPGGGTVLRTAFGAITEGFEPPRTFTVELTALHFPFVGASGPVYGEDGTQFKDPLKSPVP